MNKQIIKDVFVYILYFVIALLVFQFGYISGRYTDHNKICIFLKQFCHTGDDETNLEL